MPVFHSERFISSSTTNKKPNTATATTSSSPESKPLVLRGITETELKAWRKAANDRPILNYDFLDLHEIFDYPFKDRDEVWVHIKETDQWCLGSVAGRNIRIGPTRNRKQGFYYPVIFNENRHVRKYFSPLNGEMKPDNNESVRNMLRRGGWLSYYEDDSSDGGDDKDEDGGSNYSDTH